MTSDGGRPNEGHVLSRTYDLGGTLRITVEAVDPTANAGDFDPDAVRRALLEVAETFDSHPADLADLSGGAHD